MKREFSAGGIIFNNQNQVLLTQHSSNHYWGFPKGHPKEGENMKQTALREVKEEAGVEAEIIEKAGDTKYIFTMEGEKIFKVVTLYLMKYLKGDIKNHDWEVEKVGWFTTEQALEKLSFKDEKELLKKALELRDGR